jgi:diaminopimelate epimerase
MTGSGNDFIVFDARDGDLRELLEAARVRRLCDRRQGIGADGVVALEESSRADLVMQYFNRDGSRGAMCGNAALCITRLAVQLGRARAGGMTLETDDGVLKSRLVDDRPEIELRPVRDLEKAAKGLTEPGEQHMGYVVVGVPHLVVHCDDVEHVDVASRGAVLRSAPWLGEAGANVNFVSRNDRGWAIRTFERGVEGETLACGTGAVASASLLRSWRLAESRVALRTRSGCTLEVLLPEQAGAPPTLAGEGRLVFEGRLREV